MNGRNPIVAHEYLGESVEGKDVFIADDIISSGESMLDIGYELKKRGAKRIFCYATYAIYTKRPGRVRQGLPGWHHLRCVRHQPDLPYPELLSREWFHEVDVSKYIAHLSTRSTTTSIGDIIDPHSKIDALLKHYNVK